VLIVIYLFSWEKPIKTPEVGVIVGFFELNAFKTVIPKTRFVVSNVKTVDVFGAPLSSTSIVIYLTVHATLSFSDTALFNV